jgi:hypothetical protein
MHRKWSEDPQTRWRNIFEDRTTFTIRGCWIWEGSTTAKGYGQLTFETKHWLAHTLSYTILVNSISKGLELDHTCRVPRCINPWHLDVVTRSENHRRGLQGKLTKEDIIEIRNSREPGKSLAMRYQVSQALISMIRNRKTSWEA